MKLSPREFRERQEQIRATEQARLEAQLPVGVLDLRNDSPRSRHILETVLDVTRTQLHTDATADQADVYRRIGEQLLERSQQPGMPQAPASAGIPPPAVRLQPYTMVSPTTMAEGPSQSYQLHPPSGYPGGTVFPFQQPTTSVPLQPAANFPVASTASAASSARWPVSAHQGIAGQQAWAYYGAQYQPPPDPVTSVYTKLICRHQRGAATEVREILSVRVLVWDYRDWELMDFTHMATSLLYLIPEMIRDQID